jgi:hypothetical protein
LNHDESRSRVVSCVPCVRSRICLQMAERGLLEHRVEISLAEKAIERNQPGVLGTPADVFSKN